jgi:hypothetical protein
MKDVAEIEPFEELLHSPTVAQVTFNEAYVRQFRGLMIVGHTIRADYIPSLGLEKPHQVSSDESGCASHQRRVIAPPGSHSVAPARQPFTAPVLFLHSSLDSQPNLLDGG